MWGRGARGGRGVEKEAVSVGNHVACRTLTPANLYNQRSRSTEIYRAGEWRCSRRDTHVAMVIPASFFTAKRGFLFVFPKWNTTKSA